MGQSDVGKTLQNDPKIMYYKVISIVLILQLSRTSFTNCNATDSHGGALYLDNVHSMLIEKSTFQSNSAKIKGGGIYFKCEEVTYNCKVELRG